MLRDCRAQLAEEQERVAILAPLVARDGVCTQCGQGFMAPPCGFTHTLIRSIVEEHL